MQIVCPHCHTPQGDSQPDTAGEVLCSACGSGFRVSEEETQEWNPASATRRVGKFELLARIGAGGFGIVFKARDPELDRIVAVKVPRSGDFSDPLDLDRFLREGRSVAQLRHPNIVPVFEVGQAGPLPYLVSEFVQGVTLTDWMSAHRPDAESAARLTATLAEALHYAHTQGVIHRDVKPANILLDGEGTPRLTDFGLAKRETGDVTLTVDGQIMGTPAYMSPEQARGDAHSVDGRSDVYSLGVVFYQLLTGVLPFRGTARMLLHQVLHDEAPSARRINPRIPRDLETICMKALAKEPARRYASAATLADDLRRFLAGQPILARPPGIFERTARRVSKHRREFTCGLAGAVVVVCAVLWFGDPFRSASPVNPMGTNPIKSEDPPKQTELAADLALIPPEAFGFICLEAATLRKDPAALKLFHGAGKEVQELLVQVEAYWGVKLDEVERAILFVVRGEKDGAISDPVVVITTTAPFSHANVLKTLGPARSEKKTKKGITYFLKKPDPGDAPRAPALNPAFCPVNDKTFVVGPETVVVRILDRPAGDANPWRGALLQARPKHLVLAGLYPPEFVRHWLGEEVVRQNPSLKPWLQCQTCVVALTLEEDAQMHLEVACQFSPQIQPKETQQKTVKKTIQLLERELNQIRIGMAPLPDNPLPKLLEKMQAGLAQASVESREDSVVVAIRLDTNRDLLAVGLNLFQPATLSVREAATRTRSANNLKQIGFAMHGYLQNHQQRLPPHAIYSPDGKPLLSWRVAILPYLEMNDLYKEFKLNEAWDSPHNIKLLDRMPQVYGGGVRKSATHYQAFVGKGTVFEGQAGVMLTDITDGTSNTILLAEAADPVLWTKPADMRYDPKGALPSLGKVVPEGFHILMADGTCHFIRQADPGTLHDLITRNDGRVIDWNKIRE